MKRTYDYDDAGAPAFERAGRQENAYHYFSESRVFCASERDLMNL